MTVPGKLGSWLAVVLPAAAVLALAIAPGPVSEANEGGPAPAGRDARVLGLPEGDSILFAVRARSGSLDSRSGSGKRPKLVLRGLERKSLWFSDRPNRDSGLVPTRRLFGKWARLGFAAEPPNAALTLELADEDADTVALELGEPSFDRGSRSVRMRVEPLSGPSHGLAHLIEELDDRVGNRFEDATLFIDNAGAGTTGCNVGEIDYYASPRAVASEDGSGFANTVPAGGQELRIGEQPALFQVIGTRFGGDGVETFAVPKVESPVPGVHPTICSAGNAPAEVNRDCLMGEVQLTAFTGSVPAGYLSADGRTLPVAGNNALFAILGHAFGGEGNESFGLPNLPAPAGMVNLICADGVFWLPGRTPDESCFLSGVDLFALTSVPDSHLPADGRKLQVSEYGSLSFLVQDVFGGDGTGTFDLPAIAPPIPGTSWGVCAGDRDGGGAIFPAPAD